jgi:hypothetical protein
MNAKVANVSRRVLHASSVLVADFVEKLVVGEHLLRTLMKVVLRPSVRAFLEGCVEERSLFVCKHLHVDGLTGRFQSDCHLRHAIAMTTTRK